MARFQSSHGLGVARRSTLAYLSVQEASLHGQLVDDPFQRE
jgi:hypothetical protein